MEDREWGSSACCMPARGHARSRSRASYYNATQCNEGATEERFVCGRWRWEEKSRPAQRSSHFGKKKDRFGQWKGAAKNTRRINTWRLRGAVAASLDLLYISPRKMHLSDEAEARMGSFGWKSTSLTLPLCPGSRYMMRPVAAEHASKQRDHTHTRT